MSKSIEYNIYCDESCHILNEDKKAMVLGAILVPKEKISEVSDHVKYIKMSFGMDYHNELKWVKISPNKSGLYEKLIGYFLENDDLRFRSVIVPDKSLLQHSKFGRSHDDFYYVMFYHCLKFVLQRDTLYNIYFDYKDKNQKNQLIKLKKFLISYLGLFADSLKLQTIQSHESQIMQITDILTGAVSYRTNDKLASEAKKDIIEMIESKTQRRIDTTSPTQYDKFSVLKWTARTFTDA